MTSWTDTNATGGPDRQSPRFVATSGAAGVLIMLIAASTLVLPVPTAHAKPTPAQKCAASKNKAAGKYAACLQTATASSITSTDPGKFTSARGKCRTTFLKAWAAADGKAAKAGATCDDAPLTVDDFDNAVDTQSFVIGLGLAGDGLRRCGDNTRQGSEACDGEDFGGETCATQGFALGTLRCGSGCFIDTSGCFATRYVDNGDGTVTDRQTGLQWEQKDSADDLANLANPHDVDNTYVWSNTGSVPDGPVFTNFIAKLNDCTGAFGEAVTTLGFAGHCDWRLPTIQELRTIVAGTIGTGCGGPCTDPIFGPTAAELYWSVTTADDNAAVALNIPFSTGLAGSNGKQLDLYARGVRGGS